MDAIDDIITSNKKKYLENLVNILQKNKILNFKFDAVIVEVSKIHFRHINNSGMEINIKS